MANSTAAQEVVGERREAEPRPSAEPRLTKVPGTPDAKPEGRPAGRRGLKRRRAPKDTDLAITARYFLTKPSSNGKPEFDEEMPDENQAMIEALKRDRHFVIVTEWRSRVDVTRGAPVIEKEPIGRE
ncbi:MAG: hypothetical protein LAP87_18385 [Acidobacteriia bacterium]|nr:hypothetical protein [Terriglobia bacterium]